MEKVNFYQFGVSIFKGRRLLLDFENMCLPLLFTAGPGSTPTIFFILKALWIYLMLAMGLGKCPSWEISDFGVQEVFKSHKLLLGEQGSGFYGDSTISKMK
jgi:hypothetical protein